MPEAEAIDEMSFCSFILVIGSSALNGSSMKSTSGDTASARAMATLCCCPPESSRGCDCLSPESPVRAIRLSTLSIFSAFESFEFSSPRRMLPSTVRQGRSP